MVLAKDDPPVSSQVLGLDYRGSSPGCTYRLFLLSILCLLHKAQKAAAGKAQGASSLTDVALHRVGNEEGHGRFIGAPEKQEE